MYKYFFLPLQEMLTILTIFLGHFPDFFDNSLSLLSHPFIQLNELSAIIS